MQHRQGAESAPFERQAHWKAMSWPVLYIIVVMSTLGIHSQKMKYIYLDTIILITKHMHTYENK